MSERNYLFVSDLHLSEGRDPRTGKLSRNEDFFYDRAFADFLVYHLSLGEPLEAPEAYRRPWSLVINGDLFDFLQVTSLPPEGDELETVTGKRRHEDLTPNQQRYGLGTESRASVWKLDRIAAGHRLFFRALGWFLAHHEANRLIVIKGNHDVELFWPAVQDAFRRHVRRAYAEWREAVRRGAEPDSVLPFDPRLAGEVDDDALAARVRFPPWIHYEPGLFFVEHGNQYDPANAFVDFLNPILDEEPDPAGLQRGSSSGEKRLELPSGSLFVRYLFNEVEQVHPFADNIKPLTAYIRWALSEEPLSTARLLINNWRELPGILGNLIKKNADPVSGRPQLRESLAQPEMQETRTMKERAMPDLLLKEWRREQIQEMRRAHLLEASKRSRSAARGTAVSLGLQGGTGLALLSAIDHYTARAFPSLLLDLLLAGGAFVAGTLLSRRLDKIEQYVDLPGVGAKVSDLLNQPADNGRRASVRYHIFGHDHHANIVELPGGDGPGYRQWYVNTGCWLSTFAERTRLTRGPVQFTFLRLVPGITDAGDGPPPLLEWLPRRRAVRPVQIFTPADGGVEAPSEARPDVSGP